MPWGMPWWAWFLICLGSCCLLAFCCLPLLAAPAMGGKKKSKAWLQTPTAAPRTTSDVISFYGVRLRR
eukprot:4851910-Amphidinium_carterae.1